MEVLIQLNAAELMIEVADRASVWDPAIPRSLPLNAALPPKPVMISGIGRILLNIMTQAGGTIKVADNSPRGAIFTSVYPADGCSFL